MTIITKKDLANLNKIKQFLAKHETTDEFHVDWENVELQSTLGRLIINLENFDEYFKLLPETEKKYYDCKCECGWFGSSQYLLGGGAIADTGDYDDLACPVCEKEIE